MPKENRKKALDDAARCVLQDRNEAYGEPENSFTEIAYLQGLTDQCKHPAAKVALGAIAIKIARLVRNPTHYDSWVDIAGYAACGADVTTPKRDDDAQAQRQETLQQAQAEKFKHWVYRDGVLVKVA